MKKFVAAMTLLAIASVAVAGVTVEPKTHTMVIRPKNGPATTIVWRVVGKGVYERVEKKTAEKPVRLVPDYTDPSDVFETPAIRVEPGVRYSPRSTDTIIR